MIRRNYILLSHSPLSLSNIFHKNSIAFVLNLTRTTETIQGSFLRINLKQKIPLIFSFFFSGDRILPIWLGFARTCQRCSITIKPFQLTHITLVYAVKYTEAASWRVRSRFVVRDLIVRGMISETGSLAAQHNAIISHAN